MKILNLVKLHLAKIQALVQTRKIFQVTRVRARQHLDRRLPVPTVKPPLHATTIHAKTLELVLIQTIYQAFSARALKRTPMQHVQLLSLSLIHISEPTRPY